MMGKNIITILRSNIFVIFTYAAHEKPAQEQCDVILFENRNWLLIYIVYQSTHSQ